MTSFNERKNAFEQKYAQDAEMNFRAEARACKLFGLWLGQELGMSQSEAETFAKEVVGANLEEPGFEDVIRFVRPKIEETGLTLSDHQINTKLNAFMDEAKVQLMAEESA